MTGMLKQIVFTLLLCFLTLSFTGCQGRTDTATTLTEAEALMFTYPDSALQMLEAIPYPERLTGREQADYALLLTHARSRCRITATSDSLIRIATDYYLHAGDNNRKAMALFYLSDVYTDMGRYTEAIVPLKQAEEALEEVHPTIQSLVYSKLGYLNRKSGNYELALTYYVKAMNIDRDSQNIEWFVSGLTNILNLPLSKVQDSASVYIKQLEETLPDARPDLQTKAYNNIGVYYYKQDMQEQAAYYFSKAIQTSENVPYRSFLNLARIYDSEGKTAFADSLYQLALQSPVWATRARIYEALYNRFLHAERYQEAAAYMKRYQTAADSFYTHRQAQEIQELQAKYNYETLAREKVEVENQLYRTALYLFIFIVLSIGIAFAWRFHWKQKRELYFRQLRGKISQIELLENEKQQMGKGIQDLKEMLAYTKEINQAYVQQLESKHVTLKDVQALGLYLRLLQDISLYNTSLDYPLLCHWLDIVSQQFASRLITQYPQLSLVESNLCCLKRLDFSIPQIAMALHIKEDSVIRNIYRVCERVKIAKNKEEFNQFILRL